MKRMLRIASLSHWSSSVVLAASGFAAFLPGNTSAQDITEQAPVKQEVIAYSDSTAQGEPAETAEAIDWSTGATPKWIWGANNDKAYLLQTTFSGPVKRVELIASCDNKMTVWLNEKRILQDASWEDPSRANLTPHVIEGDNTLKILAENAGGVAGFVCKLRIWNEDGSTQDIVSDESWSLIEQGTEQVESPKIVGTLGDAPWRDVFSGGGQSLLPQIPRDVFLARPGFEVELLYQVDKETQGSWVSFTFDDKGRIIASDQGNRGLWRITPGRPGTDEATRVEKLDINITAAQGLLYAFDSLYISVNGGPGSGFYRAQDTTGDDQYDKLELLKPLRGGGEHGPHALRLSPDGKNIFLIAGNHTDPPEAFDGSRIPSNWQEDLLLPRQWDARGHARGKLAPGGWIAITDPNGDSWEMFSVGYRNPYDMDFNTEGELFAYDADMEWDMGASWYRPTRVVHVTSGSEFGWRSGTGKWPTHYPDSLPPAVDIGPGSPTGACFGTGARFPAAYQKAMFISDWTFGTIYALHFESKDGTYLATKEEFLSRAPLPLTDVETGPDGALYFTVGGRGTDSALYRVTYTGDQPVDPVPNRIANREHENALNARRALESHHSGDVITSEELAAVWTGLGSDVRHLRYAARIALEHQPVNTWLARYASEDDPQIVISASLAAARQGDTSNLDLVLEKLQSIPFAKLSDEQKLELTRAYALTFIRLGSPSEEQAAHIASTFDVEFPNDDERLNQEYSRLMVYLNFPSVIDKTLAEMEQSNQQRQYEVTDLLARNQGYGKSIAQMLVNAPDPRAVHYALVLRNMKFGWTLEQRQKYFELLDELAKRSGGASYQGFITNIRNEALENCLPAERKALESTLVTQPPSIESLPKPIGPGQAWGIDDVAALSDRLGVGRDFENGKRTYLAAQCANCHRFAGEGGSTGPDLTNVLGRFGVNDLAEALVTPNKVVSDQYQAHIITTEDGEVFTGRIISESDDALEVLVDPIDITKVERIDRDAIEDKIASPNSLMPAKLLDDLNEEEVLNLLAYLLSRGNPDDPMFAK